MQHEPVLLQEILEVLRPARERGTLVDATVGLGGHAEGLLKMYPHARLVAIDRDPAALEKSRERLSFAGDRVTFVRGRHEQLIDILKQHGIDTVDGVLADLGVSSMQLDDASRGFSFRFDAPLDMRMGPESRSAADLVNSLDEAGLAAILRDYGEEPMAKRIARAIVNARIEAPIETTTRLAEVIRSVKRARPHEIDPSTLTFQALRIAANEELTELDPFVTDAVSVAEPAARVAVIAFHSLEDRIVKWRFRAWADQGGVHILTRKPISPDNQELQLNARARSAKLRVVERIA